MLQGLKIYNEEFYLHLKYNGKPLNGFRIKSVVHEDQPSYSVETTMAGNMCMVIQPLEGYCRSPMKCNGKLTIDRHSCSILECNSLDLVDILSTKPTGLVVNWI